MTRLTAVEIKRIERQHADGIKSSAIVDIFRQKGHRFSEATLRKYVQLGLLPKSRRVGVRGRHRGSRGLYPVAIVRLVNDIKAALDSGATLEEVRFTDVGLASETQALRSVAESVLARFDGALAQLADSKRRVTLKRLAVRERQALVRHLEQLEALAARIGRAHRDLLDGARDGR